MNNSVKLNEQTEIPNLGFGVYQITDQNEAKQAVLDAIDQGYRLIDTAASYGNEHAVGEAIKASNVAREDLLITSKLWVDDTGYEATRQAIKDSLERLQLNYLDLFLIHQPYGDIFGSWRAMNEAKEAGLIKSIGVSNFSIAQITNLAEFSGVKPDINQIEVNPFNQNTEAVAYLKNYGVKVEAWAPFAEGKNELFTNEKLQKIADNHGKSIAQVVLHWIVQRGIVPVSKSTKPERMAQNLNVLNFELTNEEMATIAQLDTGESQFFSHEDPDMITWMAHRKVEK
ncbi:aldo/keto reductase [Weissella hellenica]|uniref:2,5-diketo-D-gluconate reductase A n=1 Tax=Weissella hellenica TaxID=46256 RepID=A0A4Y4G5B5_WEIHE|nr:aldo/keto reductase [Weissella hellenica]NKY66455.1 aldo/keto reductase [Weissella hellenica]GED35414.1 2,5-diketo-D-gluconic acid reductase [Weissella hellenica]SCB73837.1 2,5-diketo-D-gluconate reductase A [Weissella hellenica]